MSNREILFRGKWVGDNEWILGNLVLDHYSGVATIVENIHDLYQNGSVEGTDGYVVVPETVGQYTGLQDKNGKQIFEGDIVKVPIFDPKIMAIGFIEGAFCLVNKSGEYLADIHYIHHAGVNETEVIGNIHDNTELLGESDGTER